MVEHPTGEREAAVGKSSKPLKFIIHTAKKNAEGMEASEVEATIAALEVTA